MKLPRVRFTVRGIMIAVALVAVIFAAFQSEGSPLLGVVIVVGSTICLAYARYNQARSKGRGRWLLARSIAEAVFVIGLCDATFLFGFLFCLNVRGVRRSHYNPLRDTVFFQTCVGFGAAGAVCLAVALRRLLRPKEPGTKVAVLGQSAVPKNEDMSGTTSSAEGEA